LLIANLKRGTVSRYKLSNNGQSIISDTIHYFRGLGRFRDVVVSPDGLKIYVACDSSGSTSGPTGGVTSTPANPGSILEFTYQVAPGTKAMNDLLTENNGQHDESIDIYPNPAANFFIIYNYKATNSQISLYDISGRRIKNIKSNEATTRINVSGLPNGVYVLTIKKGDSKNILTEKIIVAR